jgi:hypothetical protein
MCDVTLNRPRAHAEVLSQDAAGHGARRPNPQRLDQSVLPLDKRHHLVDLDRRAGS